MSNEAVTRGDLVRGKERVPPDSGTIGQASDAVDGANLPLPHRGGIIAGDPGRRSRSTWRRHAFAAAPAGSSRSDAITASLDMGLDPQFSSELQMSSRSAAEMGGGPASRKSFAPAGRNRLNFADPRP
jgi:hypothetical protein